MGTEKIFVKVDSDLEEIVPGYIDARKKEIPVMWKSLQKMDFSTLQTLGHCIKGSAGGYGFDDVGLFGAKIENGAKAKNVSQTEAALKDLEDYLARLEIIFEAVA